MGYFFRTYDQKSCVLCGSTSNLSGEHKIKASLLRKEFGSNTMLIGRPGEYLHTAQGPKSKAIHFSAKICMVCNGTKTQPADREFDRFHTQVSKNFENGLPFETIFEHDDYALNSIKYLNVFRYFSKILCCQIVDAGGPVSIDLSRFALGETHQNIINLNIDHDWYFKKINSEFDVKKHASHGGLIVYGDKDTGLTTAFHSTLTIGAIRYIFYAKFGLLIGLELCFIAPEFSMKCKNSVTNSTMTKDERLHAGLASQLGED